MIDFDNDIGKLRIRHYVSQAIKKGLIELTESCQECGGTSANRRLDAHHEDYKKPLDVVFLCQKCHGAKKAGKKQKIKSFCHLDIRDRCGGEKLKNLREEKGLSRKALGLLADVHWQTIANVEGGKDISVKTITRLAEALEMPPAYFLS